MPETQELAEAMADRDRFKQDYINACELVAAMHKAAVGETRGPTRGVVEDITDLRAERDFWEQAATRNGELYSAAENQRDQAREELARLCEGEEPPPPNGIPHRPGQWIALWNAQTPAERLAHAQRILDCSLACSHLQESTDYYRRQLKAAEDELAQWRQRAATRPVETRQLADDGRPAADLADTAQVRAERDLLAKTLADVLQKFQFKTHPGRACLQTGHVKVETVEAWREVLRRKARDA